MATLLCSIDWRVAHVKQSPITSNDNPCRTIASPSDYFVHDCATCDLFSNAVTGTARRPRSDDSAAKQKKKKRRKWNEEKEGISTRTSTFVKNRSWNYYDMCEFRQRIREKKVRRFFMWQYVQDKWKRLDEEVEIRLLFGFAKSTSEKSILGRLKRTKLQMHQIHLVKLWLANSFGSLQNWQWKEYLKKWKKNSKEWNTI